MNDALRGCLRMCLLLMLGLPTVTVAADSASPATAADAAKLLDLAVLPLVDGAEPPRHRSVAGLSYEAPGTVKQAFDFHRQQLVSQQWKELPGGYATDQMVSATFSRAGYCLSVSVYPAAKAGAVSVTITNHGNLELGKLPVPAGAKPLYAGPVSMSYITDTPVPSTTEVCRKLLLAAGWQPYGTAGDALFFKQNAVRLCARVASAPAQGGKTMIDYSATLMSVDLPAPATTEQLQYADITTQLSFDTTLPQTEVVRFYREALAPAGWKGTTPQPFRVRFKDVLIFRNPAKDMLTLEMHTFDGTNRVSLKHQAAAALAELERQVRAEALRKSRESPAPSPKLVVALPADARKVQQTKARIEFKLAAGRAKAVVSEWREQFATQGWKEEVAVLEEMAGSVSFRKGDQQLSLTYTDTGLLPTEITLQAIGVELGQSAAPNP